MSIRAKDIAASLHLSTSSVSLVLNGKPGISEDTRVMVINKIKELNCEYLLRNLPQEYIVTGSIGFVVYKGSGKIIDESPFFNYALESINTSLQKNGFSLKFIYINRGTSTKEKMRQIAEANCKGLIVYAVEMSDDDLNLFTQNSLPFVLMDNSFKTRDVDCIAVNNSQGIYKAMQYLYKMGHKRIGYLRSSISITSFEERFREYRHQLKRAAIIPNKDDIITVGYSESEIFSTIDSFLSTHNNLPSAFVADNDLIGCYAMQAFKQHGYSIPKDISIIGFDDRPICTMVSPHLTTIAIPQHLFGPSAVDLLVAKINTPRMQSIKLEIGTTLIERQSVAKK